MHVTLSLASLFVEDIDREAAFYEQAFGLTELPHLHSPIFRGFDVGGGSSGQFMLGLHGVEAYALLGLHAPSAHVGARSVLTFDPGSVEAVDANVDAIVALGATLVKGPFDTVYNARQVVMLDPEGHLVRLSHQRP